MVGGPLPSIDSLARSLARGEHHANNLLTQAQAKLPANNLKFWVVIILFYEV